MTEIEKLRDELELERELRALHEDQRLFDEIVKLRNRNSHLEQEVLRANQRIEELHKEKLELEKKYDKLNGYR